MEEKPQEKQLKILANWHELLLAFKETEEAWDELRKDLPLPARELESLSVSAQKFLSVASLRAPFWLGATIFIERVRTLGGIESLLADRKDN